MENITMKSSNKIFITEPNPNKIHIFPRNNGAVWAVKREGNRKASALKSTKRLAINTAKSLIGGYEKIFIHNKEGRVERVL
jgi:hypothetical protein